MRNNMRNFGKGINLDDEEQKKIQFVGAKRQTSNLQKSLGLDDFFGPPKKKPLPVANKNPQTNTPATNNTSNQKQTSSSSDAKFQGSVQPTKVNNNANSKPSVPSVKINDPPKIEKQQERKVSQEIVKPTNKKQNEVDLGNAKILDTKTTQNSQITPNPTVIPNQSNINTKIITNVGQIKPPSKNNESNQNNIRVIESHLIETHQQEKKQNQETPKPKIIDQHIRPSNIADLQEIQTQQHTLYFRPAYVRKLVKPAAETNYRTTNQSKVISDEVVRIGECVYKQIKKLNRSNFIDIQFPSNETIFVNSTKDKDKVAKFNHWKTPKQVLNNISVSKYIDPNDLQRGAFHSQFLLSCLASLAENENNIRRLVEEQTINQNGFYYSRINVNGVWRYVVVDHSISVDDQNNIVFSHSYPDAQTVLWPTIIEKAYTKVYGTYEQYSSKQSRQTILRDLTGAPVRVHTLNQDRILDILKSYVQNGYVIQFVGNQKLPQIGFQTNYTLSFLGFSGNGNLQFRSSFGLLQEKPKINVTREGIFELSVKDANTYISHILVALVHDKYYTTTLQAKQQKDFYTSFSFSCKSRTQGFISLNQIDSRLFCKSQNYTYSPLKALVYQQHQDGTHSYITSSTSTSTKSLDIEVDLLEGQYVLIIIGLWNSNAYDFFITFYTSTQVRARRLYNKFNLNLISSGLQRLSIENGAKSTKNGIDQYVYYQANSGLIVITAHNSSTKKNKFSKDFSKAKVSSLFLLNSRGRSDTFDKKLQGELVEYKQNAFQDKIWTEDLEVDDKITWILGSRDNFDQTSLRAIGWK